MVQIAEVNADEVELTASDTIIAEWYKGVPPVTEGAISLWFEDTENSQVYYADTSSIVFDNSLSIDSVADVSCSFAGGCTY